MNIFVCLKPIAFIIRLAWKSMKLIILLKIQDTTRKTEKCHTNIPVFILGLWVKHLFPFFIGNRIVQNGFKVKSVTDIWLMEMSGIILNEIKADDKDLFWLLYLKLPTVSKSSEKGS